MSTPPAIPPASVEVSVNVQVPWAGITSRELASAGTVKFCGTNETKLCGTTDTGPGNGPGIFRNGSLLGGGVSYPFLTEVGKVSYNVRSPLAYNIIMGVAIGGLSVCFHQAFKTWIQKKTGLKMMNGDAEEPKANGKDKSEVKPG